MVDAPIADSVADDRSLTASRDLENQGPISGARLVRVGFSDSKFVLLEELIEANINSLFPGMLPGRPHRFRVTRDADIEIREWEAQDLLSQIQEELRRRRFGAPVRLEVSPDMPPDMIRYLTDSLGYRRYGCLCDQRTAGYFQDLCLV